MRQNTADAGEHGAGCLTVVAKACKGQGLKSTARSNGTINDSLTQ